MAEPDLKYRIGSNRSNPSTDLYIVIKYTANCEKKKCGEELMSKLAINSGSRSEFALAFLLIYFGVVHLTFHRDHRDDYYTIATIDISLLCRVCREIRMKWQLKLNLLQSTKKHTRKNVLSHQEEWWKRYVVDCVLVVLVSDPSVFMFFGCLLRKPYPNR